MKKVEKEDGSLFISFLLIEWFWQDMVFDFLFLG